MNWTQDLKGEKELNKDPKNFAGRRTKNKTFFSLECAKNFLHDEIPTGIICQPGIQNLKGFRVTNRRVLHVCILSLPNQFDFTWAFQTIEQKKKVKMKMIEGGSQMKRNRLTSSHWSSELGYRPFPIRKIFNIPFFELFNDMDTHRINIENGNCAHRRTTVNTFHVFSILLLQRLRRN